MRSKHRAYLVLLVFDGAPLHNDSTQRFRRFIAYFWFSRARCSPQDRDRGMRIVLLICYYSLVVCQFIFLLNFIVSVADIQ